jgi:RNA polymerase-binding transcription factor DksA
MRRTILGLFLDPADDDITTTDFGNGDALEVEEVQEDLSGLAVYHGQAAYEGTTRVDAGVVNEDGTISETERAIEDPRLTEWFTVPDAKPGFAAIDASDGEYAFRQLSSITGGWIEPAVYDLYGFTEYLEQVDAKVWQVVWSDSDEAGTWYPDDGDQHNDAITRRGLENHPKQVGFRYSYNNRSVRGTIAESGYCELYYPDDWEHQAMAQFIREELLQFAAIPDVGYAEDIADGDVGIEDLEDDEDDEQTTLDDATPSDGEDEAEDDGGVCEECGKDDPARGLREVDSQQVCIVCEDKLTEDSSGTSIEDLDSVTVADGGRDD